jgi:2-methylisocitrate lyase-like PEP mutase family enzyme
MCSVTTKPLIADIDTAYGNAVTPSAQYRNLNGQASPR